MYKLILKNGTVVNGSEISFHGDLTSVTHVKKTWFKTSKKTISIINSADISIINILNVTEADKGKLKSIFNIPPDPPTPKAVVQSQEQCAQLPISKIMYN